MKNNGFSLLELMVAVVIVGLLVGAAVPSYLSYINRAKINEAFDQMAAFRLQMEQFYQDNTNYGTAPNCGVDEPISDNFTYVCALGGNAQSFTLTATGNSSEGMDDYAFTIDESGNRTTTAFPDATVPAACWLTKAGGC